MDAECTSAAVSAFVLLPLMHAERCAAAVPAFIPSSVMDAERRAAAVSAKILLSIVDAPLGRHRCKLVLSLLYSLIAQLPSRFRRT